MPDDLTAEQLDTIESDLNKLGTPPDNCFRRLIAEVRRRRSSTRPKKKR